MFMSFMFFKETEPTTLQPSGPALRAVELRLVAANHLFYGHLLGGISPRLGMCGIYTYYPLANYGKLT